jgi:hypothetical protein
MVCGNEKAFHTFANAESFLHAGFGRASTNNQTDVPMGRNGSLAKNLSTLSPVAAGRK